jgi:hypothetical protein
MHSLLFTCFLLCLPLDHKDGGRNFLRNVIKLIENYLASHARRMFFIFSYKLCKLYSLLWWRNLSKISHLSFFLLLLFNISKGFKFRDYISWTFGWAMNWHWFGRKGPFLKRDTIPAFALGDREKPQKPQSRWQVTRPKFELSAC